MLIPGAVMFGIGTFETIVAAAIGLGFGKRATTSEHDPEQVGGKSRNDGLQGSVYLYINKKYSGRSL